MDEFLVVDGKQRLLIKTTELVEFFTAFQIKHQPIDKTLCPLCNMDLPNEKVYCSSDGILIVDAKQKKGHKERIMMITKEHGVQHPRERLYNGIQQLISVGKKVYTSDFALLSDRFSSTRYHWHIIASDLDQNADDYQQIMETPFILVAKK